MLNTVFENRFDYFSPYSDLVNFNVLEGKIIVEYVKNDYGLLFKTKNNEYYLLEHIQDCCEDVFIESVSGDLDDLLNTPILLSEETTSSYDQEPPDDHKGDLSYTWTFYKLATIKGYIDIRFYGSSNGYYSETVSMYQLKDVDYNTFKILYRNSPYDKKAQRGETVLLPVEYLKPSHLVRYYNHRQVVITDGFLKLF